jgi:hypothetical protein
MAYLNNVQKLFIVYLLGTILFHGISILPQTNYSNHYLRISIKISCILKKDYQIAVKDGLLNTLI